MVLGLFYQEPNIRELDWINLAAIVKVTVLISYIEIHKRNLKYTKIYEKLVASWV
jgi:hypothetical protein